jgi:Rrf2 family protein
MLALVQNGHMRVSAKADYAARAMVELASIGSSPETPAKGERLAAAQAIPPRFLESILGELRVHGLVQSRRGSDGGYWLARGADDITLAEIIRAVEGPLATVRGEAADEIEYRGGAAALRSVWLALRANIRQVLESVTLADVVAGELPEPIGTIAEHPEAQLGREPGFAPRRGPVEPPRAGSAGRD